MRLTLAGDLLIAGYETRAHLARNPGVVSQWLNEFNSYFEKSDYTFLNFEGCVSEHSVPRDKGTPEAFTFKYSYVEAEFLKRLPNTTFSLANNHIADCGQMGVYETFCFFGDNGISYAGVRKKNAEPTAFLIKDMRTTFLAFTDLVPEEFTNGSESDLIVERASPEHIREAVAKAKKSSDIVLVSLHTVRNILSPFTYEPDMHQVELAKAAAGAGADIVFGHQPHGLQRIERYDNAFIFHSLGVLLYDPSFPEQFKNTPLEECSRIYGGAIVLVDCCKHGVQHIETVETKTRAENGRLKLVLSGK